MIPFQIKPILWAVCLLTFHLLEAQNDCSPPPGGITNFTIGEEWSSVSAIADATATPVVGNIDGVGPPEIVVSNYGKLTILNGQTGEVIHSKNIGLGFLENELILADIFRDGCAEVIAFEEGYYGDSGIAAFDCELNEVWNTSASQGQDVGIPGIADFNGDGVPEIYYKNEIMDARDGSILVKGSGNWITDYVAAPIAVDITGDEDLEFISGNKIFSVDLESGTMTVVKDMNADLASSGYADVYSPSGYGGIEQQSSVSVADFNLDGNIDVLMTGFIDYYSSIFFWDVANGTVKVYQDENVNWANGAGRINIADVDGDGYLNATFVMKTKMYCLELDQTTGELVETWTLGVREGPSGFTGCTLFDFDGDNDFEIVYRDEIELQIIDGKTLEKISIACGTYTQEEYPVIADVDGDGGSEICVTCSSRLHVFGSAGTKAWQPARPVWNQHGYFNVNVNDDLTIPARQRNHAETITSPCGEGVKILNTFLNQAPILNDQGCPAITGPDISIATNSQVTTTHPACPNTQFEATFTITNTGEATVTASVPISFYAGDPTTATSVYLGTQTHSLTNFITGDTNTVTMSVEGVGGSFELYIVLNSEDQEPPITIGSSNLSECDQSNNIQSTSVIADVFPLTVNKIFDNRKCGSSMPDNGMAEVYYEGPGPGNSGTKKWTDADGLEFRWYLQGDFSDTLYTGSTYSAMADGTYSVVGYMPGSNCHSDTATVTINLVQPTYHVQAFEVAPLTHCGTPNGALGAFAYTQTNTNGDPLDTLTEADGITFTWLITSEGITPIGVGDTLQNLESINYTVEITNSFNGCMGVSVPIAPSTSIVEPDSSLITAAISNITTCGGTGEITAIYDGGDPDYTFEWFYGSKVKPVPESTQTTLTSLPVGAYTVIAVNQNTGCTSPPKTFQVSDNTTNPVAVAEQTQPNTSNNPGNGQAVAYVNTPGNVNGFDFIWYSGSNTANALRLPGTANPNAFLVDGRPYELGGLDPGIYTVKVTDQNSQCVQTDTVIIHDESIVVVPQKPQILAVDITPVTSCSPPNGVIEVTEVSEGTVGQYRFDFYQGNPDDTTSWASPVQSEVDPLYNQAEAGTYFVIGTDSVSGEETTLYQIEMPLQVANPAISLADFENNLNCDPSNANGYLSVEADGIQDTAQYRYEWRDNNGILLEANNFLLSNIAEGLYQATVTNRATGCKSTQAYQLLNDPLDPIPLALTILPNKNCINPDGTANVKVQISISELVRRGKLLSDFTFYWFDGEQVYNDYQNNGTVPDLNQASFSGNKYEGLSGSYSVYANDVNDPFCSAVELIEVPDDLQYPDFNVEVINHQTMCYEGMEDGRARISHTKKEISAYRFNWYEGDDINVTPFAQSTNNTNITTVNSLKIGNYTVMAADVTTGCIGARPFSIMNSSITPATPSLSLITNRTNCLVPNGAALAEVDGQTQGYDFEWYLETDLTNPVFSGSEVNNLDTTTYLVKATDLKTGCESGFGSISINNDIKDLTFYMDVTNSMCIRDKSGAAIQYSGSAVIQFEEYTGIDSIVWTGPEGNIITGYRAAGQHLIDAEPGLWKVWFRTLNGCDYTSEFVISIALKVYNGLSANNDGKNDYLFIDCIEYFPDNRISVYNRDGTLVWENRRYDNIETRFDGHNNVGLMDLELPTGTYFYFIDKGDGSEVINGYLELVR